MKDIKKIYDLSIALWFEVADDNMKRCGHPGVAGPTSNAPWNENHGILQGAIQALKEVSEKIKTKDDTIKEVEIKNPKFEMRGSQSFLIGGDISLKNGMIIGTIDKENSHSIGNTGTIGVIG